ncbi:MAG: cupin domain-containing protein [Pseudobdellovibrionaceae bacterium]|nr:cupin domain-containing protein [Pseudobdellovibrionaceae bacterium]
MGRDSLEFLINPFDGDDFAKNFWEKNHVKVERNEPNYYADLCQLSDIDALLSATSLRMDQCRIVKEGKVLPATDYAKNVGGFTSVFRDQMVDSCRIFEHYSEGATLILEAIDKTMPKLAAYCRNLERDISHKVQINAYLTPEHTQGFPIHHDTHDVFILQLFGSKKWKIYDSAILLPMHHQSHTKSGPKTFLREELTLNQGDLLYIPRGVQHEAMANAQSSLHLTLGVTVTTWADLLVEAVKFASKTNISLREAAPLGFADSLDNEAYQSRLRGAIEDLDQFAASSPDLDAWIKMQHRKTTRPVFDMRLANMEKSKFEIAGDTRLRFNRNISSSISKDGSSIEVTILNNYFEFPATAETALDFIMNSEGSLFKVDDIPGLNAQSRLLISQKFVQEGLVTIEN